MDFEFSFSYAVFEVGVITVTIKLMKKYIYYTVSTVVLIVTGILVNLIMTKVLRVIIEIFI